MKKIYLLILGLLLVIISQNAVAQIATQPSGDGLTVAYQIASIENLNWISQNSTAWNKHFIQTADIDASVTSTWATGFSPIGTDATPFTGTYNGNNKKNTRLNINRPNDNYLGLFGKTESSATIKNLNLESVTILGYAYVGALCGYNKGTVINCNILSGSLSAKFGHIGGLIGINRNNVNNCSSTGTVKAPLVNIPINTGCVGGLVGTNDGGNITNSHSSSTVTGYSYLGGLVGMHVNGGNILKCYSTGDVSGTLIIGGLVSENTQGCTVSKCYSTGNVYGGTDVGGLMSYSDGDVSNCYSTGSVTCNPSISPYLPIRVGGLMGYISATANIVNCYSTGHIYNNTNCGLIGLYYPGATVTNCYWDMDAAGQTTSAYGTGKHTADMKTQSTFTNWDFNNIWGIYAGINDGYPSFNPVHLQDGLIAYYPFNGNANDQSGFGHNGTVYGATPIADRCGNPNSAYSFDGNDDYIEVVTNNMNFPLGTSFSISLWVKAQPQATTQVTDCYSNESFNYGQIFNKYGCPYGSGNLIELFQREGKLFYHIRGNAVQGNSYPPHNGINVASPINFNEFVFVTMIKDASANTMLLYINGILVAQSNFLDDEINSPVPILFGKKLRCSGCTEPASAAFFKGAIDQFRAYNRVLNNAEIQALYTENNCCLATISTSNSTTTIGSPVEVTINTTAIQSSNIISYQFNFDYDQTKLQYVSNSLVGTIAAGGSTIVNSSTPGHLVIEYMTSTPLSGAGNILKLQFNALADGNAPLTISNFKYNATPVTCITNGTVTINENIPPTAAITYTDADGFIPIGKIITITATFNEPMANIPKPQIVLSGANTLPATDMEKVSNTVYKYVYTVTETRGAVHVSLATGKDLAGNFVVATPTSGATFEVIRLGDVDDDTFITAFDAALALNYSVGNSTTLSALSLPLPWAAWRIATTNVDGSSTDPTIPYSPITAYDAALILQRAAGINTPFPALTLLKSGKSNAEIDITVENGFVVFRSSGDLFGLNVFVNKNRELLGKPIFLNADMLSATNISKTSYAIGVATGSLPKEGDIFMKIPISGGQNANITFDIIVNNTRKQVTLGLTTEIAKINDTNISLYPNPASNVLFITGLMPSDKVAIYDLLGKKIFDKQITNGQIDINRFQSGVYTIKIENLKGIVTKKFVKQ